MVAAVNFDSTLSAQSRRRAARGLTIVSFLVAMISWVPGLWSLNPHAKSQGPLLGIIPVEAWADPDAFALWLGLPMLACIGLLVAAWLGRSKELAICAVVMPLAGFGLFILRFCIGMGAFR